jgi:hypothetical protein
LPNSVVVWSRPETSLSTARHKTVFVERLAVVAHRASVSAPPEM